MSKELRVAGLEAKFNAILNQAEEFAELDSEDLTSEHRACAGVVASYESARRSFVKVTGEAGYLDEISHPTPPMGGGASNYGSQIQRVISNSESAIAYLRRGREQVPAAIKDKLNSLNELISIISEVEPYLHAHLVTSIREYEETHYLAASVLAAKCIEYILNKLEGTDERAKADILVKKGLLKKDLEEGFLRAWKKARNYYVHDIRAAPPSGDSLSILTSACQLAEIYVQAQ